MMAVLVKRRVDTRTYNQIWLRGENKIDKGIRFSLNVSRFKFAVVQIEKLWPSILEPSKVVVSPVYQLLDFALKSPMTTIKKGLVAETASKVSSKVLQKFSKSSSDWFCDLYKETKLQILSPSFITKVIHSLR